MTARMLLPIVLLAAAATASAQEPPPAAPPPAEPEPPPPPPPPKAEKPPIALVYDGGVVLKSGDGRFELKISNRLQTRFELTKSSADGSEILARFIVPRARVVLSGYVFGDDNRYNVEFAYGDNGNPGLKTAYLERKIVDMVWFRAGLFRRPFNRQEIMSDFSVEFPEKAITSAFGAGGRDLGIALTNRYDTSPEGPEYMLAVFSGTTSENPTQTVTCVNNATAGMPPNCTVSRPSNRPADWDPQIYARVGYNLGKVGGYSEADLEGGDLRLGVGAAYKLDMNNNKSTDAWAHAVEGDFIVKVAGLDVSGALAYVKEPNVDGRIAFHAQAGYFVLLPHAQVVARFAMLPITVAMEKEYTMEIRGGFNWYFVGHSIKWLTDAGIVKDTTDGAPTDFQVRTQAQLMF